MTNNDFPSGSSHTPWRGRKGLPRVFAWIDHQFIGVLAFLFIMVGMVVSEAMMSMGMIGLTASAVFHNQFRSNFRHFWRHQALVALTSVFLVYFISGLWSENLAWWMDRLRMKLPFLLVPFAVVAIPRFGRNTYLLLLYVFLLWIALAALYSLLLYALDYEAITWAYREGRVLPTPVQHVRFSLMVAFSVAIGAYLIRERYVWKYAWEHRLILVLTLFLMAYLHVLAVRSGLMALYAMLLYYAVLLVAERRKYLAAGVVTLAVVLAGMVAYRYVPSFQNRINYTLYTLRMFEKQEQISELSDARRIGSLYAAVEIMQTHPWLGVGAGDIRDATDRYLQRNYPDLAGHQLMPHNQFLLVGAATGIIGLLVFTWGMLWPLAYRRAWRDPLFTAFHILVFSSFLVEHTIETQLGTAFYILFVLMALRCFDEPNAPDQENVNWLQLLHESSWGKRFVANLLRLSRLR